MTAPLAAHPLPTGSVQHEPPRLSASGAVRHLACSSALARETEYYFYAQAHSLAGFAPGDAANRGVKIHALAAAIPYENESFGVPEKPIRPRIEAAARDLAPDLNSYDHWVATRMVERRNEFITWLIGQHPDGADAVEYVDVVLDSERLGTTFTGTPDVKVVVGGNGRTIAGVVDYKTGQGEHKESHENVQLGVLAALTWKALSKWPTPETVYTLLLTEPQVGEVLDIGKYEVSALVAMASALEKASREALPLAAEVAAAPSKGATDIPPSLDAKLDGNASVGAHCLNCTGKICCGAFKIAQTFIIDDMYHKYEYMLKNPITPSMDTQKLAEAIQISTAFAGMQKLITRYQDEAEELALQLVDKGQTLDGVSVEEGSKRISLEETDMARLHAILKPAIESKIGRDMNFEEFAAGVGKAGKASASAVRTFLAQTLEVPEHKTVETLRGIMKALGHDTPLDQKPTSRTVRSNVDPSDIINIVGARTKERIATAFKEEAEAAQVKASAESLPDRLKGAIAEKPKPRARSKQVEATLSVPAEAETLGESAIDAVEAAPKGVALFC